jgi:hypothetical protein
LKDDLLDRDTRAGCLVFAADMLQLEGARAFLAHFPHHSRFWTIYFESLTSTIHGMVRVDSMQRFRTGSVAALLKEYGRVCGIFRIGAAAVCARYSGMRDYRHAVRFWDEMAVASQLLDDLEDLDEDWYRGRYNSIVRIMLAGRSSVFPGRGPGLAAVKGKLAAGGIDRIARMLIRRIDRAEAALNQIRDDLPYPGLRDFRRDIDRMRRAVHRERVRAFFSGARRARKRSPLPA